MDAITTLTWKISGQRWLLRFHAYRLGFAILVHFWFPHPGDQHPYSNAVKLICGVCTDVVRACHVAALLDIIWVGLEPLVQTYFFKMYFLLLQLKRRGRERGILISPAVPPFMCIRYALICRGRLLQETKPCSTLEWTRRSSSVSM